MKQVSIILILSILLSGITFTSCSKYEEGPAITLLPKSSRLQKKWRPIEYISSSGVVTSVSNDGSFIEFVKGGEFKAYDGSFDVGFAGTWEFNNDKTIVSTTFEAFGASTTSDTKIVRLKINDLGLEDEDGNRTYYEFY